MHYFSNLAVLATTYAVVALGADLGPTFGVDYNVSRLSTSTKPTTSSAPGLLAYGAGEPTTTSSAAPQLMPYESHSEAIPTYSVEPPSYLIESSSLPSYSAPSHSIEKINVAPTTGSPAPLASYNPVCPKMNGETFTSETGEKFDIKCGQGYTGTVISHPGKHRISKNNTPEGCMKKCEASCLCIAINFSQNGGCDLLSEIHDTFDRPGMTSCERMTTPDRCNSGSVGMTASATTTFVPFHIENDSTITASRFGTASERTPVVETEKISVATTEHVETSATPLVTASVGSKACKTTISGKVMLTTDCEAESMTTPAAEGYEHSTTIYDVTTEYYTTHTGPVNTITYGKHQTFTHTHSTISTITTTYQITETVTSTTTYTAPEAKATSVWTSMASESMAEYMSKSYEAPAESYPVESKPTMYPSGTQPAQYPSKSAVFPEMSKGSEYPAQSTPAESAPVYYSQTTSPSPMFYESPSQSMPPAMYSAPSAPMESAPATYTATPMASATGPASSPMTYASVPASPSGYENSPVGESPSASYSSSISIDVVTLVPIPATETVVPMKPTSYGGPVGTAPMGTATVVPVPAYNGTWTQPSGSGSGSAVPPGYTGAASLNTFSFGLMAVAGLAAVAVL